MLRHTLARLSVNPNAFRASSLIVRPFSGVGPQPCTQGPHYEGMAPETETRTEQPEMSCFGESKAWLMDGTLSGVVAGSLAFAGAVATGPASLLVTPLAAAVGAGSLATAAAHVTGNISKPLFPAQSGWIVGGVGVAALLATQSFGALFGSAALAGSLVAAHKMKTPVSFFLPGAIAPLVGTLAATGSLHDPMGLALAVSAGALSVSAGYGQLLRDSADVSKMVNELNGAYMSSAFAAVAPWVVSFVTKDWISLYTFIGTGMSAGVAANVRRFKNTASANEYLKYSLYGLMILAAAGVVAGVPRSMVNKYRAEGRIVTDVVPHEKQNL